MRSEELARVIRQSVGITLLGSVALWGIRDFHYGLGLAFGGLWSALNLWALKGLVEEMFHSRRFYVITLFAHIKLPILYGAGALVLCTVPLSIGAVIAGFHIPFAVALMKSIQCGHRETKAAGTTS